MPYDRCPGGEYFGTGSYEKRLSGKFFPARTAEDLLLPVQLRQRIGPEHDAFGNAAVAEAKEVARLVGAFLGEAVDQVIIAGRPAVILVGKPGSRYHGHAGIRPGQPEDEAVARGKKVLGDDDEDRVSDSMPALKGTGAVQHGCRIQLPARVGIAGEADVVLGNRRAYAE